MPRGSSSHCSTFSDHQQFHIQLTETMGFVKHLHNTGEFQRANIILNWLLFYFRSCYNVIKTDLDWSCALFYSFEQSYIFSNVCFLMGHSFQQFDAFSTLENIFKTSLSKWIFHNIFKWAYVIVIKNCFWAISVLFF